MASKAKSNFVNHKNLNGKTLCQYCGQEFGCKSWKDMHEERCGFNPKYRETIKEHVRQRKIQVNMEKSRLMEKKRELMEE